MQQNGHGSAERAHFPRLDQQVAFLIRRSGISRRRSGMFSKIGSAERAEVARGEYSVFYCDGALSF